MKVKLRFEFLEDYTDASECMIFDEASQFFEQLGFDHGGVEDAICDDGKWYEYTYEGANPFLDETR